MPLQIDYSVSRIWKSGFEGVVTVTNTGRDPLVDWQVTFDFFDVALDAVDGGDIIAETECIYTVASAPQAPALLPGGVASFTFTARGHAARLPVFIGDDDEGVEGIYGGNGILSFHTGPLPMPSPALFPTTAHNSDAPTVLPGTLADTDGVVLHGDGVLPWARGGGSRFAGRDVMLYSEDAMVRVSDLVHLGMGLAVTPPRAANDNGAPVAALRPVRRPEASAGDGLAAPPVPPRDDWIL